MKRLLTLLIIAPMFEGIVSCNRGESKQIEERLEQARDSTLYYKQKFERLIKEYEIKDSLYNLKHKL